jgi:uncharacterized protein YwqG
MQLSKAPRNAYMPVVVPEDGSLTDSKYFGTPWLSEDETWPTREGLPRLFVLQLNSGQLPDEAARLLPKNSLLQLFYDLSGDFPEDPSELALVRVISPSANAQALAQPNIPGEWPKPEWQPLTIKAWEARQDEYWNADGDYNEDDADEEWQKNEDADCLQGDKLLGHQFAAQGFQEALDSKGRPMTYLYQLDAGCFFDGPTLPAHAPSLFAGDGTGHIFISEDGLEAKFIWTCG